MRLRAVLAVIGLGAAVIVADVSAAGPAEAATGCSVTAAGLATDGTISVTRFTESTPPGVASLTRITGQVDRGTIPFLASGTYGITVPDEYVSVLTPVHGRIAASTFYYNGMSGESSRRQLIIGTSGGWDHFRSVINDADPRNPASANDAWLFALHPNGRLYRYHYVGLERIVAAGSVSGVGNVKTLALLSTGASSDVLIGTTTSGVLLTIEVGKGAAFTTHTTRLRGSTWQGFDTLLADQCVNHRDGYTLVGVKNAARQAFVYHVGALAGAATVIRSDGAARTMIDPLQLTGLRVNPTP